MDPLSNADISRMLREAALYGDNSFRGDYSNAQAQLARLREMRSPNGEYYDFQDPTTYDRWEAGLKGQMGTALAGGIISGLNGVTGIANNVMQANQLGDTSRYENELRDYVDYSNYNFGSYDQLSNAMSQNYLSPAPSYEDIRGMSTGEKIGNVGTSALQGAQAGFQIGGPWGAAIGGAAGLLASGIGIITGDKAAQRKQEQLNAQATMAQYEANQNFSAAHERIGDYQNRKGVVNAAKEGGQIDRKQSITSYANKVLGSPRAKERVPSNITKTSGEGGLRVRIRMK